MSALPPTVDLTAYRGDTWSQTFRLIEDNQPVDLTGAALAAWAHRYDGPIEVMRVTTNGTAGEVTLAQPEDGLSPGKWRYDLEVTTADTKVTTWIRGTLEVVADVTNAP